MTMCQALAIIILKRNRLWNVISILDWFLGSTFPRIFSSPYKGSHICNLVMGHTCLESGKCQNIFFCILKISTYLISELRRRGSSSCGSVGARIPLHGGLPAGVSQPGPWRHQASPTRQINTPSWHRLVATPATQEPTANSHGWRLLTPFSCIFLHSAFRCEIVRLVNYRQTI